MTVVLESAVMPDIVFKFKTTRNMSRSPDRGSVQRIAANALQTKAVHVERLFGSLFRTFRLRTNTNDFYILKSRPSCNIRLLRHEDDRLQTETLALQALHSPLDVLVPRLIDAHSTTTALGSPYLISGPFKGTLLSDVDSELPQSSITSIETSLGLLARGMATIPGTHFGPVGQPSAGFHSWSRCFAAMAESLLLDAEDALISLPYDFIRAHVRRQNDVLDKVTNPRLLLVELGDEGNLVVTKDSTSPSRFSVSGILDFSTAIYGDPYLCDCFCSPSPAFAEGYGKLPSATAEEMVRQHLYIVYHSLVAIVRQCYRPSEDGGSAGELTARRNLTTALMQLQSLSLDSKG